MLCQNIRSVTLKSKIGDKFNFFETFKFQGKKIIFLRIITKFKTFRWISNKLKRNYKLNIIITFRRYFNFRLKKL